ncbi:MAG: 23S rRNA (adenine(2503)-C(2))-methyltransferase RlmN [Firmicutes bacterium]|nr:23S rRNA (adenine(2503)-C(2))-methyltransferase RlmN [Bacillota bacterium]
MEKKIDLRNMTKEELAVFAEELGEKAFRGRQIFKWVQGGADSFDEMTNLPGKLRERLKECACIGRPQVLKRQDSKDGTVKFLFGFEDGNAIESVFMKYKYGNSICVSSQAGCRMGCTFCASGKLGLARNLTAGEIISQILLAEKETGEKVNHIVVMGTGEPFDNYEELSRFLSMVNDKDGLGIGMRNITISTSGLIPVIGRFAEDFPQVNLAISLHAPTDEVRSSMMPVNNKYPIGELIEACKKYTKKTHRRVTFEYAVVDGVNDKDSDVEKLVELLGGMLGHVNLIPLNEIDDNGGLKAGSRKRAEEMAEFLESKGVPATVRRSLGRDIDAACGQLRLKAD